MGSSKTIFRFGNDGTKKALFSAVVPVNIFSNDYLLNVEIIPGECPLLLSKSTMAKIGLLIDLNIMLL